MDAEHLDPPIDFNVDRFVARTMKILAPRATRKGIRFDVTAADDIPHVMNGHPSRLGRLLVVLVAEAIDQTRSGSVSVRLRLDPDRHGTPDDDEIPVETRVHCPGAVTPPDHWETRSPAGELEWVEEADGSSTIRIRTVFHRAAATPETTLVPVRSGGHSVLVVDDSPTNQRICKMHLERVGCRVLLASDGAEAIRVAEASRPDLILMDCQMPGMDGFAATRELRRREAPLSRIAIVALTAADSEDERRACAEAGMDDFLSKPFDGPALRSILARHLEHRAA